MELHKLLLEETDEDVVLNALKELIKNSEWDGKVYLVGGAVRDEIMGKKPKDLDFVVNGDLNAGIDFSIWLAEKLGNHKKGSNPVVYPRFGTSKLSLTNNNKGLPEIELEFVAPRREEYDGKSRKPNVSGGDLKAEVERRDLTINSLLKNISNNEVLDLSGYGVKDIENGIIRTTSDPDVIFKEDPLRMLRAVRFAVKYDFKFSTEVLKGIKKNAHLINNISSERIADELNKILLSPDPKKGIRLLKVTDLLKYVIEEFNDAIGMKQNQHHKDDVFMHTMDVLSKTPPELKTRLMALFHDIGKVLTKTVTPEGSVHFYNHEEEGAKMVETIMRRLKYPNELTKSVVSGVRHHMRLKHGGDEGNVSDKSLRKFVAAVGENLENILDLIHADNISHSEHSSMPNQISNIKKKLDTLNMQLDKNKPKLPINGNDLIAIGFKQGPEIKIALNAVEEAYYDDPNLDRETAINIARSTKVDKEINEIKNFISRMMD
jgi:poly(A) polymerase